MDNLKRTIKILRSMETTPHGPGVIHGMDSRVQKRRVGQPVKEPKEVSMDSRGKGSMLEVCCGARGLSHRAGNPGRAAPEVPLGEARQEERDMSGNADLTAKDERSRALLAGLHSLNGKTCAFLPLESGTRRTFILMGVPKCITEKLLLQDEQVLDAERMTRWDAAAKVAVPTDMVKVVLAGKQHPARFTRGYGSYRMRPFVKAPTAVLQLLEVWPHGQGHAGGKPRHAVTVLEATRPGSAKGTTRSPSSAPTAARDTPPPARCAPKG